MNAAVLISKLEGVRQSGRSRWRAICPAHDSKHRTPTLAIRETEDGRTLIHCFAGCHVDSIVGAVGMQVSDLLPPRESIRYDVRQPRSGIHPMDVLACVLLETTVVLVASSDLIQGRALNEVDQARLCLAGQRIHAAREMAHV